MAKSDRKKYGVRKMALVVTRILSRRIEHFQSLGIDAYALLLIDDVAGTFCPANVYDGKLGKGYDPSEITHPLPADGDEKWKIWAKRGYEFGGTDQTGDATFGGVVQMRESDEDSEDAELEDAELETADADEG